MAEDQELRKYVKWLLAEGRAHVSFERAVADLPVAHRGAKLPGTPHTAWRLLEHMRLAQWDIVEFCRSAEHVSPSFPEGYWPQGDAPPSEEAWDRSVATFRADLEAMQQMVTDPERDLFAPVPHDPKHTILEQALILADHNAYHVGQLVMLRRALGVWPEE